MGWRSPESLNMKVGKCYADSSHWCVRVSVVLPWVCWISSAILLLLTRSFRGGLLKCLFLHHQQLPHLINIPFSAPSMNVPLQGMNEPPSLAKAGPPDSTEGYPWWLAKLEVTLQDKYSRWMGQGRMRVCMHISSCRRWSAAQQPRRTQGNSVQTLPRQLGQCNQASQGQKRTGKSKHGIMETAWEGKALFQALIWKPCSWGWPRGKKPCITKPLVTACLQTSGSCCWSSSEGTCRRFTWRLHPEAAQLAWAPRSHVFTVKACVGAIINTWWANQLWLSCTPRWGKGHRSPFRSPWGVPPSLERPTSASEVACSALPPPPQ